MNLKIGQPSILKQQMGFLTEAALAILALIVNVTNTEGGHVKIKSQQIRAPDEHAPINQGNKGFSPSLPMLATLATSTKMLFNTNQYTIRPKNRFTVGCILVLKTRSWINAMVVVANVVYITGYARPQNSMEYACCTHESICSVPRATGADAVGVSTGCDSLALSRPTLWSTLNTSREAISRGEHMDNFPTNHHPPLYFKFQECYSQGTPFPIKKIR